jgi:hypothetical protein
MVVVLAANVIYPGFELRLVETKNYKIVMCSFFANHATLRNKFIDWLALNHDNVSEWGDISTSGERALYKSNKVCWSSTRRTSNCNLFSP